jgi:hypothetical protein
MLGEQWKSEAWPRTLESCGTAQDRRMREVLVEAIKNLNPNAQTPRLDSCLPAHTRGNAAAAVRNWAALIDC